jgi:hypothetical protein
MVLEPCLCAVERMDFHGDAASCSLRRRGQLNHSRANRRINASRMCLTESLIQRGALSPQAAAAECYGG